MRARSGQNDDAPAPSPHPAGHAPEGSPILGFINEMTKWVVSGAALSVLLARRDALAAWCIVGSIASSVVCQVLKRLINAQRPPLARKADPGMPSSHANSIGFLAAFISAAILKSPMPGPTSQLQAAAILALAAFLAWLRVALGYHTTPQVLAGLALGGTSGAVWLHLGISAALPALASPHTDPRWLYLLYGSTAVAVAAFGARQLWSLLPAGKGDDRGMAEGQMGHGKAYQGG